MRPSLAARVWWHVRLVAVILWALIRCNLPRLDLLAGRGRRPDYGPL